MTELVHSSTDAGVTTLTLDSPHNRNALSADAMEQLTAGLEAALADVATAMLTSTEHNPR